MLQIPAKLIKWLKRGLLILGIALIITGLLMSFIYNIVLAPCSTNSFTLKTDPNFPVFGRQVDFDSILYKPLSEYDVYSPNRPALVLVHGFTSSKVYYQGLAYELTKRGFVCLAITANGHSASGGAFTPTWENLTLSAVKYLRDNSAILGVDVNRIGLIGHSMGSFSVTVASILDQELNNFWINATVGIGGPFLNISEGFGEGLAYFMGNPMVYPNLWYNIDLAVQNVVIAGRTNVTRPYNYMNIIGSEDQAFSVASAYELVYGMSPPSFWAGYGIADQSQIVPSTTYGTFNGSARRLVVIPGLDHLLEGQDETTVIEVINWFEAAMKLSTNPSYPGALDPQSINIVGVSLSGLLTSLGGLIITLPLVAYFGNWLKPEMIIPKNAMNMKKKDKRTMILLYGVIFVSLSFSVAPIITTLNLQSLIPTDFLASTLIALPLLIQGLLLIPVILVLLWYEHRKFNLELSDYGITKELKPYLKAALYGILLFLVLYVTLNLGGSATLHNMFIWRLLGFFELFLYIFIGALVFEFFFRGMIQNKLYQFKNQSSFFPTSWMEIIKAAIITGVIEGLAMGVMVTMLLSYGGFDVVSSNMGGMIPQNMGISFSWLPPMYIVIPGACILIEIALGIIRAGLYREINRNIMASSLFIALTLAWLISILLPAVNPYAPRFVFMT
ncbi:MAG: alpha/beta hydrolase family protein [Candidatus Helarchaeota archaeon]